MAETWEQQKEREYRRDIEEVHVLCDGNVSLEVLREPFLGMVEFIHHMRLDPKFLRELECRHG